MTNENNSTRISPENSAAQRDGEEMLTVEKARKLLPYWLYSGIPRDQFEKDELDQEWILNNPPPKINRNDHNGCKAITSLEYGCYTGGTK